MQINNLTFVLIKSISGVPVINPLVPKWWNATTVPVGSGVLNVMQIK